MRRVLISVMLLAGCTDGTGEPQTLPAALPDTHVAYERMVLFMDGAESARLRGFSRAAPQGWIVAIFNVATQTLVTEVTADVDGRFETSFPAQLDQEFELRPRLDATTATPLVFRARDRLQALSAMPRGRLAGTGSTPNQLAFDEVDAKGEKRALFVLLSGDNALDNIDVESGSRGLPLAYFDDEPGGNGVVTATPWSVTVRSGRAYVSLYGQAALGVVDVDSGAVLGSARVTAPVALDATLTLDPAADADGDGVVESAANAVLPRTPTAVAVVNNVAVVAYANVLTTSATGIAQFAPGAIATFPLDGNGVPGAASRVVLTQFRNPQHLLALGGGQVLLSSTGELQRTSGTWQTTTDGGLEVFDVATLAPVRAVNLGRFGPSRPVLLPGGRDVYVPSVLRAQLARVDASTGNVLRGPATADGPLMLVEGDTVRTVFECALHGSGLVFCGVFDDDALVSVDSHDDAVRPWPFLADIPAGDAPGTIKHGVQSVAVRPGRNGVDHRGSDVFVLLSLASRVAAFDTRFVMGP